MLEVRQIVGARFKKYVLQNTLTGIVIDRRFWTISGAQRQAHKNIQRLNTSIRRINKRHGKV